MAFTGIQISEVATAFSAAASGVVTGEAFATVKTTGDKGAWRAYSLILIPDAAVTIAMDLSFDGGVTWLPVTPDPFSGIAVNTVVQTIIPAPLFRFRQTVHASAGQVTVLIYT